MNETLDIDGLRELVLELRARWKVALSALGGSSIQLVDLVASADPKFECDVPPPMGEDKLRDRLECLDHRFRNFPRTASLRSPYQTLIHLHDQGCTLITEHRIIDIWSPAGEMLGGVAGKIPWQHETDGYQKNSPESRSRAFLSIDSLSSRPGDFGRSARIEMPR